MSDVQEPSGPDDKPEAGLTGRQTYNIVSDLGTGVNVRLKDNLIQAAAILVCLLVGALVGAALIEVRLAGAAVGGFIGLVVGWIGSGTFLMVYRAVMHIRGRHD